MSVTTPHAGPSSPPRTSHRRDIQGLRGLAVLLVVANHLTGAPSGGFVGVDVFFVVSGFVITRLLVREQELNGRISLRRFYQRRVRRIMPAALITLVVTTGVSALILAPSRAGQVLSDAVWASLSVANWNFALSGTDYMHATTSISPLQHFWSLSVEEQFYLVWPLLLIALLAIAGRFGLKTSHVVLLAASALLVSSAAWAAFESATHPTWAYFSTASRGWELAMGCALAALPDVTSRFAPWCRQLGALLGLALVGVSVVTLTGASVFPFPGAVLAVVGTAVVIACGRQPSGESRLLTNRPMTYVGDLSYSLYLWHFPVVILVGQMHPEKGTKYLLSSIALSIGLALLSYYCVERPFRHIGVRRPRSSRRLLSRRRALGLASVGMVFVCTTATAAAAYGTRQPVTNSPTSLVSLHLSWSHTAASAARAREVSGALTRKSWPTLIPSATDVIQTRAPQWIQDGCLGNELGAQGTPIQNAKRCVYGTKDAKHTAVLVGDSVAISYAPAIIAALPSSWKLQVYTLQQCPAVRIAVLQGNGAAHPDCPVFQHQVWAKLKQRPADLLILTSSAETVSRLASKASGAVAERQWRSATLRTLTAASRDAKRVAVLDGPPELAFLQECAAPGSAPADCARGADDNYMRLARAQHSATKALAAKRVSYPNTLQWFCSKQGLCPPFEGTTPTTVDGRHLATAGAERLAPLMRSALGWK